MSGTPALVDILQRLGQTILKSKAPTTIKQYRREGLLRKEWLAKHQVQDGQLGQLLFLADRSISVGSSALAQSAAAFQFTSDRPSEEVLQFTKCIIAARKREEVLTRQPQPIVQNADLEKVWSLLKKSSEPKMERDVLLVILSWEGLLRASEVSDLCWADITREDDLLKIHVKRAKNDQMGLGRDSFFECKEGSNLDQLLCRWRVRSQQKSRYVFPNLNSGLQLSASAVSSTAKKVLQAAGCLQVSHHGLRRGAANCLQAEGVTAEEIQRRGRWRSEAGLSRYLRDSAKAQGHHTLIEKSQQAPPTPSWQLQASSSSPTVDEIPGPGPTQDAEHPHH